jgi:hypothetical protein
MIFDVPNAASAARSFEMPAHCLPGWCFDERRSAERDVLMSPPQRRLEWCFTGAAPRGDVFR